LLVAIAVASIFVLVTHHGQGPMLGRVDIVMFRAMNQDMQNPILDSLAAAASNIGSDDMKLYIFIISIILAMLLISIVYNNKELKTLAIILLVALLISLLVIDALKPIFGISRPYIYLYDVHVYSEGRWINIEDLPFYGIERNSFPSGHAATTFTILGGIWLYKRLRILLFSFLLLTMFFILYVGQHYISDIIAGGIIGFTIGYSIRYLLFYLLDRRPYLRAMFSLIKT
jgi:membrane-associated phospholipid phosphatase